MGCEADGLADGSSIFSLVVGLIEGGWEGGLRETVSEGHEPGLCGVRLPREHGDAAAEGEALKGLVDENGDEEDEEAGVAGDAEGHADEDAVEQDSHFEEGDLEKRFLVDLLGGEGFRDAGDAGGFRGDGCCGGSSGNGGFNFLAFEAAFAVFLTVADGAFVGPGDGVG